MKPKGIQRKGGTVEYGKSHTDSKTQSQMMRFLKQSNKLTSPSRRGRSKPSTSLNKDPHPKHDAEYENPLLQKGGNGPVKGSNWDERRNEKPMKVPHRPEKQKNNYKPRSKKATGRPTNTSKVNRSFK